MLHKRPWRKPGFLVFRSLSGRSPMTHTDPSIASGDEYQFTSDAPELGDLEELIRERGLDPSQWIVVSTTLNEWDSALAGGGTQRLQQWKVTLRRAPSMLFPQPAVHVPRVRKRVPGATGIKPELIVVEGDHQCPYHDPELHEKSLDALAYFKRKHNLTEHVLLGDLGDYPTISRHPDHPAAMATVNQVIQSSYDLLRDKREAAPVRCRLLLGNHDWRLQQELINRAERMYDIRPANDDVSALSLRRLLHLDQLGIELVEDPRGWEHAEVELIEGIAGLVVRHGWLVGATAASKSLFKRGRSLIVGHTHSREHLFAWDASAGVERQAVIAGTMSLSRDQRFPHFAVNDDWLQGFVTVTRWPNGKFSIEHARWDGSQLIWRDQCW